MKFDVGTDMSFQSLLPKLAAEFEAMKQVVAQGGYADDRASLNLPSDTTMLERVLEAAKPYQDADAVVLIGMGGTSLGAKAVQEALTGTHQVASQSPRMYYADTVDPIRLSEILAITEEYLKAAKKLVVIVSSQSGGTTETIAGAALFHELFSRYKIDPAGRMPLVTNEGSSLDQWGERQGFTRVLVPPMIGGRYSVFSPVGLFPLAVLGIDVTALLRGAREFLSEALGATEPNDIAALNATVLAHHYRTGRNIHVAFLFGPELESIGLWCRQIMAESLGKKLDHAGKEVHVGITPTVAIGSRELHSTFQLYMEGPDDKLTTFVRLEETNQLTVPKSPFTELVDHLEGKSLQQVTDAIVEGVLHAYAANNRPYTVITLARVSPEEIGALLQMKMLETMYLGALLNVNPFDQPGVEGYKTKTKRVLAGQ